MAGKITFTMIKPSAFKSNYTGAILKMINEAGFVIRAMKTIRLTKEQAGAFYSVHEGKPFYETLVAFMSSGPIIAIILCGKDPWDDIRGNPPNLWETHPHALFPAWLLIRATIAHVKIKRYKTI